MPERRVTLLDVARAAGVSRSTVSYAYNDPERVSTAVRERVLDAAAELGYAGPDPAAASLRRGRAGALGVLFTETLSYAFDDPAAVLFLRGIASVGERADVGLTLLPVPPDTGGAMRAVRGSVVDGVIVYSLPEAHPAVQAVVARRLPIVRVDMPAPEGQIAVRIDDRGGAREVAAHVLGMGHRSIGILADRLNADDVYGPADAERRRNATFPVARWRLGGYADALREAGLDPADAPVLECAGNTVEAGRRGADDLLAAEPSLTALLCMTDQLARGAVQAAIARGLQVPADLSVTGFDDLTEAAGAVPPLTTVRQDHIAKGARAARALLDPAGDEGELLGVQLVVRGSTGPARDG
jgi:DNA-binding LacI/PurR family transcriptional regulator